MKFHDDFLERYMNVAPLALAIERWFECSILAQQEFQRPILDIGCGDGVFASVLFAEPIDLGIDPDPKELARAQQLGGYHELLEVRGDAIPRPDGSFKTIFSNSVLEHIEDVEPVLREAKRLLAPGGTFYATVPSHLFDHYNLPYQALSTAGLSGPAERYRVFFDKFWRHYHYHSVEGWARLFGRNGFSVVDSQEYAPKTVCLLNDFLAPFAAPSMAAKKLKGRWFLFPQLRKLYAPLFAKAVKPLLNVDRDLRDGGILFFKLAHADGARDKSS
ncbi:MAG: methyltransferase-like protein [Myxococcales bacterium]|nr:methyltransferase-like protein [Myxococcales bacterium]